MRLNDTTRAYSSGSPPSARPSGRAIQSHRRPGRRSGHEKFFALREPYHYALLRSTVTPTILKAGSALMCSIGSRSYIDVRTLPMRNVEALYANCAASSATPGSR